MAEEKAAKKLSISINLEALVSLNISPTEYVLCAVVDRLSFNSRNKVYWCYASRQYLAATINVVKGTVLNLIPKMIKEGLLETNEQKYLRTTVKWYDAVMGFDQEMPVQKLTANENDGGIKIVPMVQKLTDKTAESGINSDLIGIKNVPNNNNIDNNTLDNIIRDKKAEFHSLIKAYKEKNPTKYPKLLYEEFFSYWAEPKNLVSKNKKIVLRYEQQDFFDVGRRLATFWNNKNDQQKAAAWASN